MPVLSEWLKIMLGEIARKREDAERAREEDLRRHQETGAPVSADRLSAGGTEGAPPKK